MYYNAGDQTLTRSLNLAKGSLLVTSNPSEASVKVDGVSRGSTPRTVSDLLIGEHTIEVSKPGYTTLTQTVTINEGQTANLNVEFEPLYSDTDTLPDIIEIEGYNDPFGNTRTSDPYNADTDEDGLYDDYEAGLLRTDLNGHTFWQVLSNPRKVDSDDDNLDDYLEIMDLDSNALKEDTDADILSDGLEWQLGTDLKNSDTDSDKIGDYEEYSNEYLDAKYVDALPWKDCEVAREITLGVSKGEWADEGHDNIYYQFGQFFSELTPVGSARDAYVDYLHEENLNAGLNLLGVIPGGKFGATLLKFVGTDSGKITARAISLITKGDIATDVIKVRYGTEVFERFKGYGLTDDLIKNLIKKGIDLDKVDRVAVLNGEWFVIHTVDSAGNQKRVLQLIDGEKSVTLRNGRYAGGSLGSVPYDMNGFPVFTSQADVMINSVHFPSKALVHYREASKALYAAIESDPVLASKFTSEEIQLFQKGEWPIGYTWHHNQEKGLMQLVDSELHNKVAHHTGGYAIWCRNNL